MNVNDAYTHYKQTGDKDSLIIACYNYALTVAHYYIKKFSTINCYTEEDLAGECITRILNSIEKYDETKGMKFLSFVHYDITSRMVSLFVSIIRKNNRIKIISISCINNENEPSYILDQEQIDVINKINILVNLLPKRERKIIKEYFYNNRTLESIGKQLHLTRERIRQIKEEVLQKLRKQL